MPPDTYRRLTRNGKGNETILGKEAGLDSGSIAQLKVDKLQIGRRHNRLNVFGRDSNSISPYPRINCHFRTSAERAGHAHVSSSAVETKSLAYFSQTKRGAALERAIIAVAANVVRVSVTRIPRDDACGRRRAFELRELQVVDREFSYLAVGIEQLQLNHLARGSAAKVDGGCRAAGQKRGRCVGRPIDNYLYIDLHVWTCNAGDVANGN